MTDKKTVRDELASLTEAVRELRDDEVTAELRRLRAEVEALRAQKAAHHCTGCACVHVHWTSYPGTWTIPGCAPQPTQIWYGTATSGSTGLPSTMPGDYTVTAIN